MIEIQKGCSYCHGNAVWWSIVSWRFKLEMENYSKKRNLSLVSGKQQRQLGANWVNQPPQTQSRYVESSFHTIILMETNHALIMKASRCLHLATLKAKLCSSTEKMHDDFIAHHWKKEYLLSYSCSLFNVWGEKHLASVCIMWLF